MKHIGIFSNSGDVLTAISAGTLLNPYVAIVSGAVDFNELAPAGPDYLGVWSDDGQGTYTFTILDDDPAKWGLTDKEIGTFKNCYMEDADGDIVVRLLNQTEDFGTYVMTFNRPDASDTPMHGFELNVSETWDTAGVMTDLDLSNSTVSVDWNGTDTFVFTAQPDAPLVMDTINVEPVQGE